MDAYERHLARNYSAHALSALVAADDAIMNAESEAGDDFYSAEREKVAELIVKFADEVKRWTNAEQNDIDEEGDDNED